MSRIDRIEELLASPLAHDPDEHNSLVYKGMTLPPEELCWRCGLVVDNDSNVGACSKCITDLQSPNPLEPAFDISFVDEAYRRAWDALGATVQRVSSLFAGMARGARGGDATLRLFGVRSDGGVSQFVASPDDSWIVIIDDPPYPQWPNGSAFIEPEPRRCDMHPEDFCDGIVSCAVCVVQPRRVIEGCLYTDPEDGTCGHPNGLTPECWRAHDGSRSDCPIAEVMEQWVANPTLLIDHSRERPPGHLPFPGDRSYGGWAFDAATADDEWPI